MSHSAFTGISRHHLGRVVAELAGPWRARRESQLRERRGRDRLRAQGAGLPRDLVFTDRVLVTVAVLRLAVPHAALAVLYGVDRSAISRAVAEVRPLLTRGLLAGTRERDGGQRTVRARADDLASYRAADFDVADAVRSVAGRRNLPPAQIALAWLLTRPGVTAPIVGATKPGHLTDATQALKIDLSDDETTQLESPYLPRTMTDRS